MMAEKAGLFQDCRTEELTMSSADPNTHKRIGRGVRNFDNAVWGRVREDAVLAANFAKFSQKPTMKHHLLSTGTNVLAEASPFDLSTPCGASISGRTTARPVIPAGGQGKFARKSSLYGSPRHSYQ